MTATVEGLRERLARSDVLLQGLTSAGGSRAIAWAERMRHDEEVVKAKARAEEEIRRRAEAERVERERVEKERRAQEEEAKRKAEAEAVEAARRAQAAAEAEAERIRRAPCPNCKRTGHQYYSCPWKRGGSKRPRH